MDDDAEEAAREQREDDDEEESLSGGSTQRVRGRPFTPGNPWRFAPGQSGNPSGRAKGIGDLIDKILAEEVDTKGDLGKREALELMVRATVRTALKGGSAGTSAFRELLDRRYGRVPLSVKLGPDLDEGPRAIEVVVVSREDVVRKPSMLTGGNGSGSNGDGTA